MPQVNLKGPKGVLRDLIGSLRTPRVIYLGPLKVLRGFQMDLEGFSEASRSPFWTLWILRDLEEIYGLFWALCWVGLLWGFHKYCIEL